MPTMPYSVVKKAVAKRVEWVKSLKEDQPCAYCGGIFERDNLHFHHRDASTKLFNVSEGAYRHSRKILLEEIEKCDIICHDCHEKTHGMRMP
jgi:hypothetical protein